MLGPVFRYHDGRDLRPGDRILYANSPGRIAFLVGPDRVEPAGTAEADVYRIEEGPGVMVECEAYTRIFLPTTDDAEDLILVGRG